MKTNLFPAICAAVLSAIGGSSAEAATLTPNQALARIMKSPAAAKAVAAKPAELALSYSAVVPGTDRPAVYVFTPGNGRGFILAGADDRSEALLGFSDSGRFDPDAMPPAMKWWLGEYGRQIESADRPAGTKAVSRPERAAIDPMTATRWNQD